jgi:hypothetical protein
MWVAGVHPPHSICQRVRSCLTRPGRRALPPHKERPLCVECDGRNTAQLFPAVEGSAGNECGRGGAAYSDEKVANRTIRVWHGAKMALERWTNPKLTPRT